MVAEKAILADVSLSAYFMVGFFVQTLIITAIALPDMRKVKWSKVRRYDIQGAVIMGVLSAGIGFFFINALVQADNAALVAVAGSFQLPITALAGFIFLNERNMAGRLYLGLGLGFVGLLLSAL